MDVYWKDKTTEALGRDGWTLCIGLNIFRATELSDNTIYDSSIGLTPINNKDNGIPCHIMIPVESVPEIIKKLWEAYQTEKFFVKREA